MHYNRNQQRQHNQRPPMPKADTVNETYNEIKKDYTVYAEKVIKIIKQNDRKAIKANQIRTLYSLVVPISQKFAFDETIIVETAKLSLRKIKIKIAYQIGRDSKNDLGVKVFNDYTNILGLIDVVLNSDNFLKDLKLYCDYFEALVAYHKYYIDK